MFINTIDDSATSVGKSHIFVTTTFVVATLWALTPILNWSVFSCNSLSCSEVKYISETHRLCRHLVVVHLGDTAGCGLGKITNDIKSAIY